MKRSKSIAAAGLALGLVTAMQSGCAGTAKVTQPAAQPADAKKAAAAQPEAAQKAAAQPEEPVEVQTLSGKVVETQNAGGYTYILLEKDGKQSWAAVTSTNKAKVGENIALKPGMVMTKFQSKALNRTFDQIIFSEGVIDEAAQAATGKQIEEAPATLKGKVKETMDSAGYTYVKLEKDGKETWVALPVTKVQVGQELEVQSGMQMLKFKSKTLNRTFDAIVFSPGVATDGNVPAPSPSLPTGHPSLPKTESKTK